MMKFSIDQGYPYWTGEGKALILANWNKSWIIKYKSQGNLDLTTGDKERRQNKKPA